MTHLDQSIFGETEGRPRSRGERHRRRRKQRRRGGRRLLILVLALTVLGGAAYGSVLFIKPMIAKMTEPKDFPGPGSGSVKVVVASGDTGSIIAATLEKAGVVKTTSAFLDAAGADPKAAASIQPGTYTLKEQMKGSDALVALTDATNRYVARVTVREGLWANETYAVLAKASGIPVADYVKAAKDIEAIGLPVAAKGNVEGWLFPSTYEFPEEADAAAQLKLMVAQTIKELQKAGVAEGDYERIIIVGSIVEAEASGKADRPKVARVVDNRLANKGGPNFGFLQLDSTASYGVKRRSITTTDAERADPNPWNTYKHPGLPVGPISNPGAAAIEAAANPASGPWLFFVTVNPETGETKFANTPAEHQANVNEFQSWCQAHSGKC